jgi:hypothetical protein
MADQVEPDERTDEGGDIRLSDLGRYAAAWVLLAAGVIHFAYAPSHLDESGSHGAFFLTVGWLQIVLAAGLAFRLRPERAWLAVTALANTAVIGVWIVSRTVGVPGSDAESVGLSDTIATVCEVVAVLAAVTLLLGLLADRVLPARQAFGLGGAGVVATVALVSLSVTPSFAGDHGVNHGANGHGGGGGHSDGHMNGGAAGAGADDFAQVRLESLQGHLPAAQVEEFKRLTGDSLANELRTRSRTLQQLPEAEREERIATYVDWAVDNTLALLDGAQSNGEEMHTHGPVEWQPITDPGDQVALQDQLAQAGQVIQRFPTVAAADAAGYFQISPWVPGIAAHWINGDFDGEFDPAAPEMLLFNGTEPTSELVGLSYATTGPEPPEGFVGPNDSWHAHPALCMVGNLVVGIDGTPEELCESVGGSINRGLADLWMGHLWQIPGWENPWGLFAAENPRVSAATSEMWLNRPG